MNNAEKILKRLHPQCKVSIPEARELSWRLFYDSVGGPENLQKIDGTDRLKRLLKMSESCFSSILEGKLKDEELEKLIKLPSTETWKRDYKNRTIRCPVKKSKKILRSCGRESPRRRGSAESWEYVR